LKHAPKWQNYDDEKKYKKKSDIFIYLDLWFFIKLGPCLRNSVVSPKTGHPIVPGGKPFLLYLNSFHLNRAEQKQNTKTKPRIPMKIAIEMKLEEDILILLI
jgi:hypothetical protein